MLFEFATATRIIFGPGTSGSAGQHAAEMGSRAFVVTGSNPSRVEGVLDALGSAHIACSAFPIEGEPTFEMVEHAAEDARKNECDMVIAVGGGSVVDAGKAVAAMLTNDGEPLDYVEGIGRGRTLQERAAPFIAIPTTAGTGAEVTKNAVLGSAEHGVKVSLRSPLMLPALAIVDPELTYSLPPEITATTGLDALTQLLEAYTSKKANPLTDAICREGLQKAGRSLPRAYHHGDDANARQDMALASLFSGLALANAGLGAAHGFAGPLGGSYQAPHGALCARLLPYVVSTNITALSERDPSSPTRAKYDDVAAIVLGRPDATSRELEEWLHALCSELCVPGLRAYGLSEDAIPEEVDKAKQASSMKGNPIELTDHELTRLLHQAL